MAVYEFNFVDEDNNIYFPNNTLKKEKILLVGEVQSGKTKAIINLIKKAIENNFYFCVILGGTTNLLLSQTDKRLEDELSKININGRTIKFISKNTYKNDLLNFDDKRLHSDNFFYVFSVLKNHVSFFHRLMSSYKKLSSKKIIFIDDESDYGTGNENTKNHKILQDIYKNLNKIIIYFVTATPYANILLSKNDNLYHDRIEILKPGNGYNGLKSFENNECYIKNDTFHKNVILYLSEWVDQFAREKGKFEFLINVSKKICKHNDVRTYILEKFVDINEYKNEIEIIILNSKEQRCYTNKKFIIYIGGYELSRGITFSNLNREMLINSNIGKLSIDVLMQQARWLGYRKNFKTIKVFIDGKSLLAMSEARKIMEFIQKNYKNHNLQNDLQNFVNRECNNIVITQKNI